jgi:hypothetical protein
MKSFLLISVLLFLFSLSCGFGDERRMRMAIDGTEVSDFGLKIALTEEGVGVYNAFLSSKGTNFVLQWKVNDNNPENWAGMRFRANRFKIERGDFNLNFDDADVGILITITDATGSTVSGQFSGSVGIGAGSHSVSDGTFRAPVTFWKGR